MRLLEGIQGTIGEARAPKIKGLPRKYKNKKKYDLEAVLYANREHFNKNHSKMSGVTDLIDFEEAMKVAKPGMVIDIYVYQLEENEFDPDEPFRELFDQVVLDVV